MNRYLSRTCRRLVINFHNLPKACDRGQKNGADRVHSSQASNSSHDFNNFGWRHCPRTSFAQQQVVNALCIGDREKASKLLLNIGHVNGFLSVDDFAYILEYCAQTPDPLFVMETWEVMKDKAVSMNRKSCRFIVEALSKGGYLKEALNWLTSLWENDHVNAALPMFNILLAGCGIKKSLKDADYCLELMESQRVGKSEITYWELLKLAVMQENLSAVHEIWKDCTRFMDSVESGRSNSQNAIADGIGADNWMFAVKPDERTKFSNEKMKLVSEMASPPTMNFLRWSFNDMLHACAWSNNFQLAEQLFLQMHNLGVEPSQHSYDGFVKAVINGKGVAYGMKVIKSMEKKNIEPYNDTLAALSIGHSKNLDLDMAEALLEKISGNPPKYIHPFNALLAACDAMDEPERAVRVLAKMKHLNINSNIRTYELMFSLFGTINVPYEKGNMLSHADVVKRIKTIEMDMMMNGIRHSYRSMQNLIRALGAEGMIQEMFSYLNVAENMFWQTDPYQKSDMYNIVLHALVKAKESHRAIEVFKNMRSCGLPANVATYNIMIECCSILTCFKSACALVSLMLRDGFCPQLLTYTALIKVLLANENFEGALHLLDQARSEGIHPDIQLFNAILREASLKGRIDMVEPLIEGILRERIQPDPSTLCYTFSAYFECGFHNTAMEALQVLCMRMISEENILHEKRIAYEDLVHNEDSDVELEIIEIFKESQEFIATALLNLRWCAITGCSISWSPEESLWAKRLSSSYGASTGSA